MSAQRRTRNRPPSYVQILSNFQRTTGDSLNLFSAELRNNGPPLADGRRADGQRPGDIRGRLEVIDNIAFQHADNITTVQSRAQPQFKYSVLTSVDMDKFATLADRLADAMAKTDEREAITASDLARACSVSPAAVSKWLDGRTKTLKAETFAAASRALGVREEWLRTGKLPRERAGALEEHQVDRVIELLQGLREPLAALNAAIEALSATRTEPRRKRA